MSIFKDKWVKENTEILQTMYPEFSYKYIKKFVKKEYENNIKDIECVIHNNYVHKKMKTTLINVIDWVEKTKPICGGYGVFYRNQHQVSNPLLVMILKFIKSRKYFKDKLEDITDKSSYEYKTNDRLQLTEKVNSNSIYGSLGMMASFIFNLYTAPSVTSTGQSLISTTEQAFEMFLGGNILFNNMNECVHYIQNIITEPRKLNDSFLIDVSIDDVIGLLCSKFYKYKNKYETIIYNMLVELDQETINRIYYKNNLYEFSKHKEISSILYNIFNETKSFKNPNKIPKECEEDILTLWKYYEEFVVYNHSPINRIQRLVNEKRKVVLTIDTDSNMINVNPWVEFIDKNIIDDTQRNENNEGDLVFISVNIMAVMITRMVTKILNKYTKDANVPEDFRHYINMKNEFLFSFMLLADVKKRYITSVRLREGDEIYPEKMDIKGFDFVKSGTSEEVMEMYKSIIKKRLIGVEQISIKDIMNDLSIIEKDIKLSIKNGEKKYLTPSSINEFEAYVQEKLYSNQGVLAVLAWNNLCPDKPIQLPAKVDIVKVKLNTDANIEKMKNINLDIYNNIQKNIVKNNIKSIADKLVYVIAIPKNIEKIPDWIIPFIDIDSISNDILKKFYPVLDSLGMATVKTAKREYLSNIINI
jgi:hypothetical protein